MLSEKTAINFQQIVSKLKGAPAEAYTTPAGALAGVLLTKLLMRRPELRHYLMAGAGGAGAGFAAGRLGRHYLEGYRRDQELGQQAQEATALRRRKEEEGRLEPHAQQAYEEVLADLEGPATKPDLKTLLMSRIRKPEPAELPPEALSESTVDPDIQWPKI